MAQFPKRILKRSLAKIADGMGLQQIINMQQQIVTDVKKLHKICRAIQYQIAVAPDGLPIPPHEFHFLVSGNDDHGVSEFLEIGKACADCITTLLNRQSLDLDDFRAILDFGCGCGRVIRHFHSLQKAKLYGTDYNPTLIDWCRRNLLFADFGVNQLHPPLTYSDGQFDLVYVFSVFTHLPASLQLPWITELSRILNPGGYLLITTHGAAYAREYLPLYEKRQFDSGELIILAQKVGENNECAVYHPVRYVTDVLAKGLEIVDFIPGEVIDRSRRIVGQDVYFAKKP